MKKKKRDEKGKAPEFPFLSQETKKKKMASIKFLSFSPPGEPSSSVEVDFHLETIQQTGNSKGRERKGKKKALGEFKKGGDKTLVEVRGMGRKEREKRQTSMGSLRERTNIF